MIKLSYAQDQYTRPMGEPKYGMKILEAMLSQTIKESIDYLNYLAKSQNAQSGAPIIGRGLDQFGVLIYGNDQQSPTSILHSPSVTTTSQEDVNRYLNETPEVEVTDTLHKSVLNAIAQIDHVEVTKESVKSNVLNEVKNQLPKFVPKVVSDYVQPYLERSVMDVMKKNLIDLFKSSSTPSDNLIKFELKEKLYKTMFQSALYLTHDAHRALYDAL
ncbi:hypothetical protein Tco_1456735 [Tanacetum coccineum]